ncbi:MAG: acetyl-CoA carboxylase biotin carboxylase subunit, partial [Spirochaetes bacterium]|nr:acetyl-CoA carboxylase biotin carboxylase subunit [Spirochaetota bacterium]
ISEERARIDLVKEQISVAAGEKLRFKQNDINFEGHSFECRINAEDPYTDFTPSPGKIENSHFPGGMGVRVDSHIYSGYEIPPYYDSLLAKLIVWAGNRDTAIKRMLRSLDEMVIEGIKTTIPFHKQIFKDKNFIRGNFDTHFLETFKLK